MIRCKMTPRLKVSLCAFPETDFPQAAYCSCFSGVISVYIGGLALAAILLYLAITRIILTKGALAWRFVYPIYKIQPAYRCN